MPVFWQAEVAGVLLLGIVLLVAPSVGSVVREPDEVPAAVEPDAQDAAVAERFRPLLFFDSGEVRFPLDVQDAIDESRMQMCRKAVRDDDACETVEEAGDIDRNLDYLEIAEAAGTPAGRRTQRLLLPRCPRERSRLCRLLVDSTPVTPRPWRARSSAGPACARPRSPARSMSATGRAHGRSRPVRPGRPGLRARRRGVSRPRGDRCRQHEHVAAYHWDEVLKPLWASLVPPGSPALAEAWESLVLPAVREAGDPPARLRRPEQSRFVSAPVFHELPAADARPAGAQRGRAVGAQP